MVGDRDSVFGGDGALVEAMLEEGLLLFGHNKADKAVALWRRVLELAPGNPRALDYLESAGAPAEAPIVRLVPKSSASVPTVTVTERDMAEAASKPVPPPPPLPRVEPSFEQRSRLATWFLAVLALAVAAAIVGAVVAWLGLRDGRSGISAELPATNTEASVTTAATETPSTAAAVEEPAPPRVDEFFKVVIEVSPDTATIEIDGAEVARGLFVGRFARSGERHIVKVSADGYHHREITFVDAEPPARIQLEAVTEKSVSRSSAEERERRRIARKRRRAAERAITAPAAPPAKAEPAKPAKPEAKPTPQTPRTDNIDPWSSQ